MLADACHEAGRLDEKSRRLVKLGLAIGTGPEGATHSATRNALAADLTPAELQHAAVLGISTLGFPASMRAMTWIADCLPTPRESGRKRRKRKGRS